MDFQASQHLTLEAKSLRRLEAFGRGDRSDCYAFAPQSEDDLLEIFDLARKSGKQIVLRGAGRSYGDASLGDEMIALTLENFSGIVDWDHDAQSVTAGGGCTLLELCRFGLQLGWWPPVVSGTSLTTLAGAVAMDIHGKNNFLFGTFCDHVIKIKIVQTNGTVKTIAPDSPEFQAIRAGFGLMAIVTEVTIKMKPVTSAFVGVTKLILKTWEQQFGTFNSLDNSYESTVSWISSFGNGSGIFEAANPSEKSEDDVIPYGPVDQNFSSSYGYYALRLMLSDFLLRQASNLRLMQAQRESKTSGRLDLYSFNFQLDKLNNWDKAYIPGYLVQFQSCIPVENAEDTFQRQFEMCTTSGFTPRLAVLKRHRPSTTLLPYLNDGFSLAMDLHCPPGKEQKMRILYEKLAESTLAGRGNFYLAKDFLLTEEQFKRSIPGDKLGFFRAWKHQLDPENLLNSKLNLRLKIAG